MSSANKSALVLSVGLKERTSFGRDAGVSGPATSGSSCGEAPVPQPCFAVAKSTFHSDLPIPEARPSGASAPHHGLVLNRCLKRIRSWRPPPNWSWPDWLEEVGALAEAISCHAEREFDPSRGVPLDAFTYQRVIARALTRYRQEWAYALHCVPDYLSVAFSPGDEDADHVLPSAETCFPGRVPESAPALETLQDALGSLSSADRKLMELLFWEDLTESQVARRFGVSQPAISKRKRAALCRLQHWLRPVAPQPDSTQDHRT
jgi:DNA-directed RNA polymerase specialized sigma24 family protein